MSDLQCAATVLLAQHGEAEDGAPPVPDAGGALTERGRHQARLLADRLRERRVAVVYSSPVAPAVQTAEIAADVLGVAVRVREDLRGPSAGESGHEVVARVRAELETVSDLHRGESVLVVSQGGVVSASVADLAQNLPRHRAPGRTLGPGALVEVAADADGWWVRSWAGAPVADPGTG